MNGEKTGKTLKRKYEFGELLPPRLGKHHTKEAKIKISVYQQNIPGGEFDDFVSSKNERARKSKQYAEWRKAVFERDNYTCQWCGGKNGYLVSHHKKRFADYLELRYELNNGLTLCFECHKLIHKLEKRKQILITKEVV